jgi:hypothetical protein
MTSRHIPSDAELLIVGKTSDGLSFRNSAQKFVDQVYFDGKDHASKDPDEMQGLTTSTERADLRTIRSVEKRNGKSLGTITYAVSADGKLMTAAIAMTNGSTSFIVWERVD